MVWGYYWMGELMGKSIKKVLMLLHYEMDHTSYMLYDGLYKVLGKDNVDIFPYINHIMGQGRVDEGYILDDGKRGWTVAPSHISNHETPNKSFEEIADNIKSGYYDIIAFSNRTYAVRALDRFITHLARDTLPSLVLFEGEDYSDLNPIRRLIQKYNPVAAFKREYIPSEISKNGGDLYSLFPLPFSAITDTVEQDRQIENKDIDVFALFGNTQQIRENIVREIGSSDLPKKYRIHVGIDRFSNEPEKATWLDQTRFQIPPMMSYKDYQEHMSRAKINIVARGWGNDSIRRFEAPCYSGLVLADRLPIITPDDFIDGQHIIYYNSDLSDLIQKIEYYLNNPVERERIGKAGRDHCMKYHTTEARARYFLEKVEGRL